MAKPNLKIDIGPYIKYLLKNEGLVHLEGVGSIFFKMESSRFSEGNMLLPPKPNFYFEDSGGDAKKLVNLIASSEGISNSQAKSYITSYSQKVLNNLLNYDIAKIGDVGFIEKAGNETIFTPSESELQRSYFGLQPVYPKTLENFEPAASKKETSLTSMDLGDDWINYLLALILGTLMIMTYQNYSQRKVENANTSSKNIERKHINTTNGDENQGLVDAGIINERNIPEEVLSNQTCIIIVGGYSVASNGEKMRTKLLKAGYDAFYERSTGRVGIEFNCSDKQSKSDLLNYIKPIREKYSKDAWYWRPRVSVE